MAAPQAKASKPPEPVAVADPDLPRFEGLYRWRTGQPVRAVVLGGKRRLIDIENKDVEKGTTTLKRTGPNRFLTGHPNEPANHRSLAPPDLL